MPTTPALRLVPPPDERRAPIRHLRAVTADPPPEREIPAPTSGFVCALAVQGYEVLAGTRNVRQLGPLISVPLARNLLAMQAVWRDRRTVCRDNRVRIPHAVSARIDRPIPTQAEAAVVLSTSGRIRAVALRLEWVHRHWRACELVVL